MSKDDGGAAFPYEHSRSIAKGMRLRDYFAGQALTGLMASQTRRASGWQETLAWDAYSMADAMIAERAKP